LTGYETETQQNTVIGEKAVITQPLFHNQKQQMAGRLCIGFYLPSLADLGESLGDIDGKRGQGLLKNIGWRD